MYADAAAGRASVHVLLLLFTVSKCQTDCSTLPLAVPCPTSPHSSEAVGGSVSELTGGLGEHTYTTKTRGERVQPAAQPAGEGTYVIAKGGSKKSMHLG
jgi:hypothetical protein